MDIFSKSNPFQTPHSETPFHQDKPRKYIENEDEDEFQEKRKKKKKEKDLKSLFEKPRSVDSSA
jgi:hypothetical protein